MSAFASTADDGTPFSRLKIECRDSSDDHFVTRPGDIMIRLSDGRALGLVQAITWNARVGEAIRCTVETIMTPAELEVALQDTKLSVVLSTHDNPYAVLWTYATHHLFWRPLSWLRRLVSL